MKLKINSIVISLNLKCFATASSDGTVNIYNIFNYKLLKSFNHPNNLPIHNVRKIIIINNLMFPNK